MIIFDGGLAVPSDEPSAASQDEIVDAWNEARIEMSISVPFERFVELKQMIERRQRWQFVHDDLSYFEAQWKPKSWSRRFRFLFSVKP